MAHQAGCWSCLSLGCTRLQLKPKATHIVVLHTPPGSRRRIHNLETEQQGVSVLDAPKTARSQVKIASPKLMYMKKTMASLVESAITSLCILIAWKNITWERNLRLVEKIAIRQCATS